MRRHSIEVDDVEYHWVADGRNVTWRITHEPTGIVVEGSTKIDERKFTKKRLRIAEVKLQPELLAKLRNRVARRIREQHRLN